MDKPRIHALINIYNDHVFLPLAIDSVRDSVTSIIIADGAYQKYLVHYRKSVSSAKPWSTDGTREIVEALSKQDGMPPMKMIDCPGGQPWKNQTVKRTALLDAVPVRDWFIVLDADEMLYGNVDGAVEEVMGSGCIAGCMPLFNPGMDMNSLIAVWHPRIFLKLPDMYYERKHWFLCDFADRVIEHSYPLWFTNQCVLAHFKIFKHHRRLAPHMSYMLDMSKEGWQEPGSGVFKKENEVDVR